MRRKFFIRQNDTKINNFDEGVLILEPFFWANVIFKICFFSIKSYTIEVVKNFFEYSFPGIVTLQSYVMILWMLLFIHAVFVFQSKSRHFTRGRQTMEICGTSNCNFWDRSGKFWKWHCLRKTAIESKTPSSKLMILVSFCWEKNSIRINAHNFFIFFLVFLKLLIVSVAFFLGHPVYGVDTITITNYLLN